MKKLLSIGILSKRLSLTNQNTSKPKNHVLRYWKKNLSKLSPERLMDGGIYRRPGKTD